MKLALWLSLTSVVNQYGFPEAQALAIVCATPVGPNIYDLLPIQFFITITWRSQYLEHTNATGNKSIVDSRLCPWCATCNAYLPVFIAEHNLVKIYTVIHAITLVPLRNRHNVPKRLEQLCENMTARKPKIHNLLQCLVPIDEDQTTAIGYVQKNWWSLAV